MCAIFKLGWLWNFPTRWSVDSSSHKSFTNVDFPAPFFPIIAIRLPTDTFRVMSSSNHSDEDEDDDDDDEYESAAEVVAPLPLS